MTRQASIARRIMYTHVPKDGKTPVYDAATKKWMYKDLPTETQISSSSERLLAMDENAAQALDRASAAESAAETAQATADSKVSLADVRTSLFPATGKDGDAFIMTELRFFCDDDGWKMSFCSHPAHRPAMGSCSELGYAGLSAFYALEERVAAIEQLLGIS